VSPDSSHYAYFETIDSPTRHYRIHAVDVPSGLDRVVYDQGFYVVVDYESEGIYLAATGGTGEGEFGLWLVDATSGVLRQVAPPNLAQAPFGFYLLGSGAAWYGDVAPGDQPPHLGMGPMDRLLRFDLKTKVSTPWFRRPGMQVQAIGFDGQGHPVVSAEAMSQDASRVTSQELWIVRSPNAAQRIYPQAGSTAPDVVNFTSVLADDHGIWFGSGSGLFLYTPDGQFRRVSAGAADVAGRCL
jgi:hypothetical protein